MNQPSQALAVSSGADLPLELSEPWRPNPDSHRRFPKRVWIGLASIAVSFGLLVSGLGGSVAALADDYAEFGTTESVGASEVVEAVDATVSGSADAGDPADANDLSGASDPIDAGAAAADAVAELEFAGSIAMRGCSAGRTAERTEPAYTQEQTEPTELAPRLAPITAEVAPGTPSPVRLETRTEIEAYERIEQENPNRYRDLGSRVIQTGQTGQVTRVYRYVEQDGTAIGTLMLEIVAAERQDHIVEIGTRARPVVVAPAAPAGGGASYRVDGGIPESVWVALAQCESGGRASVISAGGRFHGLYQFSVATWNSVGGTGLPSQATPYEQRYRAVRLQARSGWGQWPACSRRIGVR